MGKQTITNKFGLPQTIVDACKHDTHRVSGDISVTQLIDAPQVRILKRKHDYETDASEMLYAMMGTALHHILERANMPEERKRAFILTAETIITKAEEIEGTHLEKAKQLKAAANYIFGLIPHFFGTNESRYIFEQTLRLDLGGLILYGTFDLFDKATGILYDYKFCSTFNWTHPEARKKWKTQTNIYAFLLEQNGYKVNGIKVVAFFRDWNSFNLNKEKDYPQRQTMEINIELMSMEERIAYITTRRDVHMQAEQGYIPECTGEERWASGDQYAVKSTKLKNAIRVFPNKGMALSWIQENRHKYNEEIFIQERLGDSRRCEKYCVVAQYCEQRQKELLKQQQSQLNK